MAKKPETNALQGRLKRILGLALALAIGCYVGNGVAGEWLVDLWHIIVIAWTEKRASLTSGSTVLLLVAGFLLGQGAFLFSKRWISELRQKRVQSAEGVAAWDPSLSVATRFGLHRYLEQCERWASEDPTTRIPSLAIFKIKGLGGLNDTRGTLVATELLQDIAVELRVAALPDSAGRLKHFFTRYRPRPQNVRSYGTPPPRFAARWSGAKFALAFRELEALQVISVVRELTAWARRELKALGGSARLEVSAAIAIGTPGIQPRELATAALRTLDAAKEEALVTVVHDPTDLRGPAIAQMVDVATIEFNMHRTDIEPPAHATNTVSLRNRFEHWLRNWGATAACFLGAFVALQIGAAGKNLSASAFPWPDTVTEFPLVDSSGTRTVRLERTVLPNAYSSAFKLLNPRIIQAHESEKRYQLVQVQITVENTSAQTQYVCFSDFQAIDASQHRITPEPERMIRVANGLIGRWLQPGERWTGWLFLRRMNEPIIGIEFQPDRFNSLRVQKD